MTNRGTKTRAQLTRVAAALLATTAMMVAPGITASILPQHATIPQVAAIAYADDTTADTGTSNGTTSAGGSSETTTPIAGPVPNVIITNFTYGDGSVSAGSDFTLAFTFQNKGKVAISNMVVTVDGGENFAIAGGTNTFYFDSLAAGGSNTQSVPMQALAGAKSGAQGVTVSFRYEYVDSGARNSNSSDIKISVPVSQPDRFQLNDPVPPEGVTVGTESTITMEYVNKGKGDIANVEASIEGDDIETVAKTQYIGNVASGTSGSIGFAFTPTTAGELNLKLSVTYEDSDGKSQTKEFPLTVTASDAAPTDDSGMVMPDETVNQGAAWWVWVLAALGAIAVVVISIVLVRRHRKKKAKAAQIDEEWDEWKGESASSTDASSAAASPSGESSAANVEAPTQVIDRN
ncbi:ABC transporter permease [Bifidobacterium goeldii]|uniref:ABC transporter permease n=1 Tax=Bifidobacterium goeldii TaxID=2306975 RepID=A0A430FJJ5_9BIFI|nr:CARDB domain-containing protein [Bifidobacterium goeldii]RSX53065.1 ABC transporter permease [Bifidobacterium goeldii]